MRSLTLSLPLIAGLFASAHGQILLQDDFNAPAVNTNLWEISLPFAQSQVTQAGGLLTTTERGVVATVAGFDVPIEITGRLTLHQASENFAIRLRTDLSRSGYYSQFYEITGARVIFSAGNNRLYIDELGLTNDGYPRLAEVPFTFVVGRSYDFKIIDTKTNLTVFIDGTNLASVASSFATGNRVEFDGRIFSGESTSLDFIRIAQLAPTLPSIMEQPQSVTVAAGTGAGFSVTATGTDPLDYQWSKDGVRLSGETNATLTLANVQPPQIGDYRVVVGNLSGSVTSLVASLDISDVDPALWRGLVGYYPFSGNAGDASGWENNGTNISSSYATDRLNQEANSLAVAGGASGVLVNGSPSLDVYRAFTLSAWLFTTNNWNDGGYRAFLSKDVDHYAPGAQFLFRLGPDKRYILWVGNGSTFTEFASVTKFDLGQWHHVSATFDSVAGKVALYVDGKLDASYATGQKCFSAVNYPVRMGRQYTTVYGSQPYSFVGQVDDVRIYNRALASNELAQVYLSEVPPPTILAVTPPGAFVNEGANVSFVATAAGSPPLTYQWQFNADDIAEATHATLSLNNVVFAQAGNYTVVVTGPGGTVSSNAVLAINRAPLANAGATEKLLISPNGSNAVAVLHGSLSSDPDGDALTYAWFHLGATNPFASGVVAITSLPVGANQLTLIVDDGMASGSQEFAVEVITISQAVDRLAQLVQSGSGNAQPLAASLRAALASIDRSHPETAINQLEAFKNKALAQVMPVDPELAAQLLADAQAIIDALNGGPEIEIPVEITSIGASDNGKPKLKIRGRNNRAYVGVHEHGGLDGGGGGGPVRGLRLRI